VSPTEAKEQLQRKRDAVPAAMAHGRQVVGEAIVSRLQAEWPRGRGPGPRSGDLWRYDEATGRVVNDSDHAEHVHDGLADKLVAQLQAELHPLYEEAVTRFLDEVT
jgi:hypothetical protein